MSALLAASLATSTIGGLYSGFSQAKSMEQEASDLNLSAGELLYREKINENAIDKQSQSLYGSQVASVASSGADVSSGSPLAIYSQTLQDAAAAKSNMKREADIQASMMKTTAQRNIKQAGKVRLAAILGASGTVSKGLYDHNKAAGEKDSSYWKPDSYYGPNYDSSKDKNNPNYKP